MGSQPLDHQESPHQGHFLLKVTSEKEVEKFTCDNFFFFLQPGRNFLPRNGKDQEMYTCMHAQSCPALCYLMNRRPPGSSVHGISQVRIGSGCHFLFQRNVHVCASPQTQAIRNLPCVQGCHLQVSGQTRGHTPFLHNRHPNVWSQLTEGSSLHFLGLGLCHWHLRASWIRGVLSISLFL